MSSIPSDLVFAPSHEWVRDKGDGTVVVGITDHAQEQLGDVVYVELPEVGGDVTAASECAVVESVKAASDIYAPVSGVVTAVNEALVDAPETLNADPYGDAWMMEIRLADGADLSSLLSPEGYAESIDE